MNILVTYESRGGHTRQSAEAIAAAARELGNDVVIKPVAEVTEKDVRRADKLFVGTWVQGLFFFAVRPAGANHWVAALPPLVGKRVSVFCTYALNPRGALDILSDMLAARGADIVGEHAFHHNRPTEGADQFVKHVLEPALV